MLYAISFLMLFSIGGLTGIYLGALAVDVHLHDTYFIVAHFHYVMMGGTVIAFLGGLHYWWPKMFGRMYNEKLARDRLRSGLHRLQRHVLHAVPAGNARHAATLLQLPASVPDAARSFRHWVLGSWARVCSYRCLPARDVPQADGRAQESLGRPYARVGRRSLRRSRTISISIPS